MVDHRPYEVLVTQTLASGDIDTKVNTLTLLNSLLRTCTDVDTSKARVSFRPRVPLPAVAVVN